MRESRKDIIWLAASILLFILLRLPTLFEPFGRDQGIFATIASGLLDGKIPYLDLWDHKPPGIYFLYAAAFKLMGKNARSISIFDGIWTIVTLVLLFRVARVFFEQRSARLAVFLFAILSSGIFFLGWWGRGQPEVFMLLPLLLMIYCLRQSGLKENSVSSLLFAGISAGIAFSFKYSIFLLLFLISLYVLLRSGIGRREIEKGILRILPFFLAIIITILPFLIFFSVNNALGEFFDATVTFNLTTHINHPLDIGFLKRTASSLAFVGVAVPLLWSTMLVFALYGIARLTRENNRTLLMTWGAGILLSILLGWWLFPYHFMLLIPPLSLLASYGFYQLIDYLSHKENTVRQMAKKFLLYLLVPFLLLEFLLAYSRYYVATDIIPALLEHTVTHTEEITPRFRVLEWIITDFSYSEDLHLSLYLKNNTQLEEKIFIWGWEPLVYFLSDRKPASRFIFLYPLIQDQTDRKENFRDIFLNDLAEARPRYFVVARKDQNPIDNRGSEERLSSFPEIEKLLRSDYCREAEMERFILYRRIK